MSKGEVDHSRRRLLTGTAGVFGGIGVAATAVPFVSSMAPSARAQDAGAPVEVPLGAIQPGELKVVEWRRKPVWVLRRTAEELAQLAGTEEDRLRDPRSLESEQPDYCRNPTRSIKPEFLVAVGVCTHLGCSPTYRPEPGSVEAQWPGGFLCPCHGGRYDLAGRVFKGVPPPANLPIPPHHYTDDQTLVIGVDSAEA